MTVSSQFVTIEIGKLIKLDIVKKKRNDNDRRSSFLSLTEKGVRLLREVGPMRQRTNDLMFRSLDESQAKLFQQTIDRILADGKTALHELEAPQRRDAKAPSATQIVAAEERALPSPGPMRRGTGTKRKG